MEELCGYCHLKRDEKNKAGEIIQQFKSGYIIT